MANDLVAVLGARLDQFAADLDQAGNMADSVVSRIESAFDGINPGFGGLATLGVTAATAATAIGVLMTALHGVSGELAKIAKDAEYVGLTVEELQRKVFAAGQGGVSNDQATTDLRNVAKLLAEAKENENSLTKLLDANNIKYKDRNDRIIGTNQLLTIAGDLLGKFHSMPEKVEAAKMLGLSENWVQALRNGGKAFDDLGNSADAAGTIIDKSTIAKAEAFDRAWKQSTALLSSQFKAVTADVAGWLDGLIEKAGLFIAGLAESGGGSRSGQERFNAVADALDIARRDTLGLAQDLAQVDRVLDRMRNSPSADQGIIAGLEEIRVKTKAIADEAQRAAQAWSSDSFPGGVPLPASRPGSAGDPTDSDARLPKKKKDAGGRDQFDISVDEITRRTATLKADTAAVFENNAVQAQLRAEFRELTALVRDNAGVTQEQVDKYEELRKTMSAVEALNAAGINLEEKKKVAFLSSSEGIKTATGEYDKAKESLSKINSASQQVGSALSSAFADAVLEGKNLGDVLLSLEKTLARMAINSVFSSFFNAPSAGGLSPFASLLGIGHNAEGTDNWRGGLTWVGERGKELVNLPRGSQVIPNDVATKAAGGGSQSIIYNIDAAGADTGTVARIYTVLQQHARQIGLQGRQVASAQSMQLTGVGRQ